MRSFSNTMRSYMRYLHLGLGLASGLIISLLGITGSLYVFEPEISAWLEKENYLTQKETSLFEDDIAIATFIEKETHQKIESLQWPQRGRETYVFKLFGDDHWYYLDQTSATITRGGIGFGNGVFSFLLDLHTSLTLGDIGYVITATASLIFAVFMLTTGLYLWWPHTKGRWKSSFRVKWKASPKRLNYDLHNITGFYLFLPLFLMGITGAYFHYDSQIQWVLDKLTFSEPVASVWETKPLYPSNPGEPLSIQEALLEMNQYYPDHYKRNLWMTDDKEEGTLSFAYQKYRHVHAGADTRIFLRVDQYTGEVMAEQNPDQMPTGAAVAAKWLLPLHFGEFGGLITRILWFIIGFVPALLTFTGVKMWLGRGRKKISRNTRLYPV